MVMHVMHGAALVQPIRSSAFEDAFRAWYFWESAASIRATDIIALANQVVNMLCVIYL
jgi:hypothetical protein